ncbi:PA0069 family radical SAM protein [Flaviaesturariibacter aridisoli]|uniref:PA0069 family radical SAM protein n=1 Tax=Flaviaesturariibacter aridisoli TaxID=2545761 RepID=A0A4R4E5Z3_9BACT|nr:PA0069 family radical SAM protein [Flaviaesturariibacter aridisoli]TCZ73085.1 PA0069 family radical SAM protein [Flaviaesturariibacter aridisoli]
MTRNNLLHTKNDLGKIAQNETEDPYVKGRGAQFNTANRFDRTQYSTAHVEGIDEWVEASVQTQFIEVQAKTLVNKVESPDVGMLYSMNPYQGCEHGCIYCYARNSFEYLGFSAGLDFESKIHVKQNAAQLLRQFLQHPKWTCVPLSLSGNTDCYQPAERRFRLTRSLLEVCLEFNQPVGIITKNAGVLRDADLLQQLAERRLVSVIMTITSLQEDLRRVLEPRTTTGAQRLRTIEGLSKIGVQTGVMLGPMIPGLNEQEMPAILKAASEVGATFSAYTFIRLNGAVKLLFHDWLYKNFPDRADKVWHFIESAHGGRVNDSEFGRRMRGEGNIAQLVADQYKAYTRKYGFHHERLGLDCTQFRRPGEQMKLF